MPNAVDMHSHFWPRGLLAAARTGGEWFGWRPKQGTGGPIVLTFRDHTITFAPPPSDLAEAEARTESRRVAQGIDFEAVMVVGFLLDYLLPPREQAAMSREINEELADLQARHGGSYRGLGHLPMQDPDLALEELTYAVGQLGLRSFAIGSHVDGKNLDDPSVRLILEAISESGASISVHPVFFDKLGQHDRLARYYFKSSFGAPLESSIALMSTIHSGLFDSHPDTRMWFSHGGGIAQFSIGRFALRYGMVSEDERPMEMRPDEYLSQIYYGCLVHDDSSLRLLIERVGADRVTVGTDHPFSWDHPGGAANWIRAVDFLSEEEKIDILWRNAARFLGLNTTQ